MSRLITYLPYPNLPLTASCLHTTELEETRHSALEILRAIVDQRIALVVTLKHPCYRMWKEFPLKLISYLWVMNCEWVTRGNEDNLSPEIATLQKLLRPDQDAGEPWWWMLPAISRSHISLLLSLRRSWYSAWFPEFGVRPVEPTFWPVGPGLTPVPF